MSSIEELKAQALIGDDVKRFLESDLGRTIVGIAQQEIRTAVDEMVQTDPADLPKVRDIQLRMAIGASFEKWLIELFQKGEEALSDIQQQMKER